METGKVVAKLPFKPFGIVMKMSQRRGVARVLEFLSCFVQDSRGGLGFVISDFLCVQNKETEELGFSISILSRYDAFGTFDQNGPKTRVFTISTP